MDRLQHHLWIRLVLQLTRNTEYSSDSVVTLWPLRTHSGDQLQPSRCFEMDVGVVDESLCDAESRPEDRHRKCKTMDCPARFES